MGGSSPISHATKVKRVRAPKKLNSYFTLFEQSNDTVANLVSVWAVHDPFSTPISSTSAASILSFSSFLFRSSKVLLK